MSHDTHPGDPGHALVGDTTGATVNGGLEFHPLANLFPLMEGKEFEELVADIRKNGLRQPIVLFEGKILDGRNRYRAAMQAWPDHSDYDYSKEDLLGTGALFKEFDPIGDDPLKFVLSTNLHRRHLTTAQRSAITADIANLQRGDNQHAPNGATSQEKAAEMMKVSRRSVQRAVQRKKEDPDAHERAKRGEKISRPRTPKKDPDAALASEPSIVIAQRIANLVGMIKKEDPQCRSAIRMVEEALQYIKQQRAESVKREARTIPSQENLDMISSLIHNLGLDTWGLDFIERVEIAIKHWRNRYAEKNAPVKASAPAQQKPAEADEPLPAIDVTAPETTVISDVVSTQDKASILVIKQERFENLIRGIIRPLIQKLCQQAGPKHAPTMCGAVLHVLGQIMSEIQREAA